MARALFSAFCYYNLYTSVYSAAYWRALLTEYEV